MSGSDYRYSASGRSRALDYDSDYDDRPRQFKEIYHNDIPAGYHIVPASQSRELVVVRGRPPQTALVRRPGMERRVSSLDRDNFVGGARGQDRARPIMRRRDRRRDPSESSHSDSSRDQGRRRRRPDRGARSNASRSKSKAGSNREKDSATEMSSSAEEKEFRKIKRKEVLTGLFAAVATIHAVAQVHSTVKQQAERKVALAKGEITEEESRALGKKARVKQLASIGIAGIGIKGAIDEVKEAHESHKERREREEARERHHQRRLELQKGRSKSTHH